MTGSEWWRGGIIYQIYPRSFFDSDGDGVGDLKGVISRLDYIKSLGVDAIWLSPFFKSPMRDFGYDIEDYTLVDPIFGSNADFQALTDAAHQRGLKVVIDLVLPHTSDRHAWFQESARSRTNPKADWYVWADPKPDGTPPNNWQSIFGGYAWSWEPRRRQYYLHHFLKSQPNLNWHNAEVVEAMMGVVRFWLERGVDGFRLDAITTLVSDLHLRDNPVAASIAEAGDVVGTTANPFFYQKLEFSRDRPEILGIFQRLRHELEAFGGGYTMGEIGDVDATLVGAKYTDAPNLLHSFYSFKLTQPRLDAGYVRALIETTERHIGNGWTTWSIGNHDVMRAISRFSALHHLQGNDAALHRLAVALAASLRGGACLYQGDELGLTEADLAFEDLQDPWGIEFWPEFKGRDGCRTPIPWISGAANAGFSTGRPWLPIPPDHHKRAVDLQESDTESPLAFTRRFLAWRRTRPELVRGSIALLDTDAPVLAFERRLGARRTIVALNISNDEAEIRLDEAASPDWIDGGPATGVAGDRVALPPFGIWFGTPR